MIAAFVLCNQIASAREGVILLHGLCRTKASMGKMERMLSAEGFRVANIAYPSRLANVQELADEAIPRALNDPALRGCRKIHFVTHSMGGILVRSYFNRNTSNRLGRVVMLGAPNQGSEVIDEIGAWWLTKKINGPAAADLAASSDSYCNRLGRVNFETGLIAGDRSINWINSMMIPGPDDGKVSVNRTKVCGASHHLILHSSHPYLMKNDRAIEQTVRFLRMGSFSAEP